MSTQTQSASQPGPPELLPVFQELLPTKVIHELIAATGKRFYQRLFTPLVVIWGFLFQRLHQDHSCDAALAHLRSGAVDDLDTRHPEPLSQRIKSESTAGYCKGRQRLPLQVLQGALGHTGPVIRSWLGADGLWLGHPVSLLDGTTVRARPTPELVQQYGQPKNQHGTAYWVLIRVVVAFCLFSGALVGLVDGPGHTSEQALTALLLAQPLVDSVYVGDRNFGVFSVAQAIRHAHGWAVLRLTRGRARAIVGRKLRPGEDVQVRWIPSPHDQLNPGMSTAPIEGRVIYVRLEPPGFRPIDLYLFTTLLDSQRYTVEELLKLYGLRWHVELDLRYVKATLDMDELTGQSVEMVRKELTAGLLAYNLVRGFMVQAAQRDGVSPLTLSFTRCWRRVWHALVFNLRLGLSGQDVTRKLEQLLNRLARCKLPVRSRFRIEPRAVRRRPAVYPNLKGSRAEARQHLIF